MMQPHKLLMRLAWQTLLTALLMGAVLLGAAGRWDWIQAWAFLAIFVVSSAGFGAWLVRRDPALLAARLGGPSQPGQPVWDRLFLLLAALLWFAWMGLMGWQARAAMPRMGAAWNAAGALAIVIGFVGVCRVFAENSFAAPQVRLQERQTVIATGPYALVRHPMYAAGLLYIAGIPLLLDSPLGLAVMPLIAAAIMLRAVKEERLLAQGLPGYGAYAARVRWRLIPGVW
jgi:protein-S-isoprenylcysteine O-methyltransferase Ste14